MTTSSVFALRAKVQRLASLPDKTPLDLAEALAAPTIRTTPPFSMAWTRLASDASAPAASIARSNPASPKAAAAAATSREPPTFAV